MTHWSGRMLPLQFFVTTLLLMPISNNVVTASGNFMIYPEGYPKMLNSDIFYDRVVCLKIKDFSKGIGVFINSNHVLTSFNPFRKLITSRYTMHAMKVEYLNERHYEETYITYMLEDLGIICARQVVPMDESRMGPTMWHGTAKMHSPVHDLMVVEVKTPVEFFDPDPKLHKFFDGKYKVNETLRILRTGPLLTFIANSTSELGNIFEFVSLGYYDKWHINKWRFLGINRYSASDDALVNCAEWIPRYWGHFICIKNLDDFIGIGSGTLLFHNRVLFGIGSFTVRKDRQSILVFTDVRRYYDQIFWTCSIKGIL